MKKNSKYLVLVLIILVFLISICFIPISVSRLIPIIETQVKDELGVKIHIERLVLRVGPIIKLKSPIVHVLYEDGQKFAQIDNVKFYIPITSLLQKNPRIANMKAKKLIVKTTSEDKYLQDVYSKAQIKDFNILPNIYLKEYTFSYLNKKNNDNYILEGQLLNLDKIKTYKSYKIKTQGVFCINKQKHINYDLLLIPNVEYKSFAFKKDIVEYLNQIKELDLHSDIIADVKFYYNQNKNIEASGFVNLDNISVLDTNKKDPKSFIYLTLWGDKASVLSNIYTSLNKKVYIEGQVKNTQKPNIDLKVKTDEIDIKDLYKKLKFILDFSRLSDIKSVTGTLNANFTLKGDLKKIKSNGFIKITNAGIESDSFKIKKINSEIDLSNNSINIVKTVGFVNESPIIARGHINKNIDLELVMNKVDLNQLCPSQWGIKKGVISLITHISGTFDKLIHKENLYIENLLIKNDKSEVSVASCKLDTNKSNFVYINDVKCKTKETDEIKIPTIKLLLNPEVIKIQETKIYMPNSMLTAKLDIYNFKNVPNFIADIDGFINSKDIKKLDTLSNRYPIKLKVTGNKTSQNINAQILFEKTDILDEPTVLNLISKIENNSIKIEDLSLSTFSGKFVDDLKNNLKGSKLLIITGNLDNLKKPVMKNIRLFIPQQLNLKLIDTLAQLKGDLFINGEFDKPEIIGQLLLQNLFNQQLQLSLTNSTVDFNKNNVIINAPLLKIGDSSLNINALVSTDFSKDINIKNLNIKSKYINTDTILMYKDSPFFKSAPVFIQEGKFYAEKALMDIYGSSLYLSALTSDFSLKNNLLDAKNINAELYNGKLSGSLTYNLHDEQFGSKMMVRGVSAEPIFNIISTRKDSISGTMNFDSDFTGELTSKQSLKGNIKFIISNGRLSTLGKLEHLLYAQNVIADNMLRTSLSVVTKAITLKDTGLFKDLRGEISLENGIANISFLQSQGPLMTLFIRGNYNILNDYANLVVLGRLSDEIITGLGAFGDFSLNKLMVMLTGEEQNNYVKVEDYEKIPQLPMKNTKEFRSIINGIIDKPSSVKAFNWISYSQKTFKQKEIPTTDTKVADFIDSLPY